MTQHLLKGASALLGSRQAGAKAGAGPRLGRRAGLVGGPVGGACRDPGRPAQLPPSLRAAQSAGVRPQGAVPTELGTSSLGVTEDLVSRPALHD